jgi:crossover junction endodeoxyribonuclease RusA
LYPPDRRKRDVDNTIKPTLDSLAHAGVMVNDVQVKRLTVEMFEHEKPGRMVVRVCKHGT